MRKEQIEEIFNIIVDGVIDGEDNNGVPTGNTCADIAESLYNAGYRKRRLGEWHTVVDNKNDIVTECTACKKQFWFMKKGQLNIDRMPYCPNCGAKMKGGAE